ncbi:hypothetical protein [Simiduia litorea]
MIMGKLKAALVHLGVTTMIVTLTAWVIFGYWYPEPYSELSGAWGLFGLVLLVEICLGPLMSFVVFNASKSVKELVFDYFVVGFIQLAGLSYGVYSVFLAHPIYVVYAVDRYELVVAADLLESDRLDATQILNLLAGPTVVAVKFPDDVEERTNLLFSAVLGGKDIHLSPEYYVVMDAALVRQRMRPLTQLRDKIQAENRVDLLAGLDQSSDGSQAWVPFMNNGLAWTAIVDTSSGIPIRLLDFDPF